jgi:hypothetical protein
MSDGKQQSVGNSRLSGKSVAGVKAASVRKYEKVRVSKQSGPARVVIFSPRPSPTPMTLDSITRQLAGE